MCWAVLLLAEKHSQLVGQQTQGQEQPNIILINLDDADMQLLSPENMEVYFPNLSRFAKQGLQLGNFHVTTPLCGPSRASLFTAKYAHRTGIRTNDPTVDRSNGFDGGMEAYCQRGFHEDDLSTWMKDAGYRTMMIGKFLHSETVDIVPPGWDDFFASRGANYFGTARFTNEHVATGQSFLEPLERYRTVQEREEALMLIDQHRERQDDQPFFLYLAPLAPHQHAPGSDQGMVEEQYKELWPHALMPMSEDYQEHDFSDKSTAIRDLPLMSDRQVSQLIPRYRQRLLSLKSIDDTFAALWSCLEKHELLDSTFLFLTSDNGFSNGQHRMIGKGDAFNRSTHVPTYVLGPGVPGGVRADHLLAHIDLAPTLVDLAGGDIPADLDGKPFTPLLLEPQAHDEREWREAILIENWESRTLQSRSFNTGGLALRFFNSVYVEWADGTPEFYDLEKDPWQVENQWNALPESRQTALHQQLLSFRQQPTDPITTVAQPFRMNQLHSRLQPIQGMAESAGGISGVRVLIWRLDDYRYWDGNHWQLNPTVLEAEVTNPGQTLTTWRYSPVPTVEAPDTLLGIQATACDSHGNMDPDPPWVVFRLDHTRPFAEILKPEGADEALEEFRISGIAWDEAAVDHLRIVIRDRGNGAYWSGQGWVAEWCWFQVPVRRSGRWNFHDPNLTGSFYVSVRAVDTSGNVQSPPESIRLRVTPPPEMASDQR